MVPSTVCRASAANETRKAADGATSRRVAARRALRKSAPERGGVRCEFHFGAACSTAAYPGLEQCAPAKSDAAEHGAAALAPSVGIDISHALGPIWPQVEPGGNDSRPAAAADLAAEHRRAPKKHGGVDDDTIVTVPDSHARHLVPRRAPLNAGNM
jgi:hypothetical protein